MRFTTLCGLLAAGALLATGAPAKAQGRCGRYWIAPGVIYVMPAPTAYYYYYPAPAAPKASTPSVAAQPKRQQDDDGAFYYTPGGAVAPARPAATATPAYAPPIGPIENSQPPGWWFR